MSMANVLFCSIGHFQRATKGIGDVLTQVNTLTNRGLARIFQRGGSQQGHHPGIADYIWFIPLLSLVYQWAQSYYRGMKAHIN